MGCSSSIAASCSNKQCCTQEHTNGTGGLQLCVYIHYAVLDTRVASSNAMQCDAQTAAQICQPGKVMRRLPGDLLYDVLWKLESLPQGPCT